MNPPIVKEVTKPRSQRIIKITAIVVNINLIKIKLINIHDLRLPVSVTIEVKFKIKARQNNRNQEKFLFQLSRIIAVAIATFKDSVSPYLGIVIFSVTKSSISLLMPCDSFPKRSIPLEGNFVS